jgi:tetratricopeptide (TPR) repeat protein
VTEGFELARGAPVLNWMRGYRGIGFVLVIVGFGTTAYLIRDRVAAPDVCGWPVVWQAFEACRSIALLPPLPSPKTDTLLPVIQQQITEARAAAEQSPREASAVGRYAMTLHVYLYYDAAEAAYRRAQGLRPDEFAWVYYRAVALAAAGRHADAAQEFQRALAMNPNYLPARLYLAQEVAPSDVRASRDLFAAVVAANPNNARARFLLGQVLAAAGSTQEAVEQFKALLALDPMYGKGHYALALAYRRLGDTEAARAEMGLYDSYRDNPLQPTKDEFLDSLLELDQSSTAQLDRANAFFARNQLDRGEKVLLHIVHNDPTSQAAHNGLIDLYRVQQRWAEAEQHYRQALEIKVNLSDAHYAYGRVLEAMHRYKEAVQVLELSHAADPNNPRVLTELGTVRAAAGDSAGAEAALREAIAVDPSYRPAHLQLAPLLFAQQRDGDAFAELLLTLQRHDNQWPIYARNVANAYYFKGLLPLAEQYYRSAYQEARALSLGDLARTIQLSASEKGIMLGQP